MKPHGWEEDGVRRQEGTPWRKSHFVHPCCSSCRDSTGTIGGKSCFYWVLNAECVPGSRLSASLTSHRVK